MSQIAANGGQPQVGDVFGKWTLLSKTGRGSYVCRCECGIEKPIGSTELLRGARKKGCRRCQIGFSKETARRNELYGSYVLNAKKRKLDFALSRQEAELMFVSTCHYCGKLPSPNNGIDRMDNSIGYFPTNCVACCGLCNRIKNVLGYEEFFAHLKSILEFRGYHVTNRG
jgi:hypothetical protein